MQEFRQRAKRFAVAIDELARGDAFARSGEDVLQAVVIGSGRETSTVRDDGDVAREYRRARARRQSRRVDER
jgi:hypothetical protein